MERACEKHYCEVCGVRILNGKPAKYCQSHAMVMRRYNIMVKFLESAEYKKLPEIKYKFPVLKKVMNN